MTVLKRRPSTALVIAMIALFVALGGTAGAVVTAAVPLAKRALVADNAKKLEGKSAAQIGAAAAAAALSQSPAGARPASSTAGLTVIKSVSAGSVPSATIHEMQISCDSGQTAVAGGMSSDGLVATFDSYPSSATTWTVDFGNLGDGSANVTAYAVCQK
jgi:hypothetical protein